MLYRQAGYILARLVLQCVQQENFFLGGSKLCGKNLVRFTQRMTFSETEGAPICVFLV